MRAIWRLRAIRYYFKRNLQNKSKELRLYKSNYALKSKKRIRGIVKIIIEIWRKSFEDNLGMGVKS